VSAAGLSPGVPSCNGIQRFNIKVTCSKKGRKEGRQKGRRSKINYVTSCLVNIYKSSVCYASKSSDA